MSHFYTIEMTAKAVHAQLYYFDEIRFRTICSEVSLPIYKAMDNEIEQPLLLESTGLEVIVCGGRRRFPAAVLLFLFLKFKTLAIILSHDNKERVIPYCVCNAQLALEVEILPKLPVLWASLDLLLVGVRVFQYQRRANSNGSDICIEHKICTFSRPRLDIREHQ